MKATRYSNTRKILAATALAAMALISGCAGNTVQDDWDVKAVLPALPVVYAEVPTAELPSICGNHPGMKLHGCAKRNYAKRTCTIVTGPQPAAWLLDHERKHCAGWDHGTTQATLRVAAIQPL